MNNNGRLNLKGIRIKIYLQFLVIWQLYALISLIWAIDKDAALKNIIFLFTGISVAFFVVYYYREIFHLELLYKIWILIFIVLIPVGMWEANTGNHLAISGRFLDDDIITKYAPTTVFHNQNDYSFYIALTIPFVLMWIKYSRKVFIRVVGIIAIVLGLYLLILTDSRTCYLGLIIGFSFWILFIVKVKKIYKILFYAFVFFLALFILFPQRTNEIYRLAENEFKSVLNAEQRSQDGSISVRVNLAKNAIHFAIKSGGFGVGAGNIEYQMKNYGIYPVQGITNVHNWWVEILANYGVLIFIGYIILYMHIIANLIKIHNKCKNAIDKMIGEALFVAWIIFPIGALSSSSIMAEPTQWIIMGFSLAYINYGKQNILRNKKEEYTMHSFQKNI